MKKAFLLLSLVFLLNTCGTNNNIYIGKTAIIMSDSLLAAKTVSTEDDYTENLGAYDRSIASNTGDDVSLDVFLNHLAKNVMGWSVEEKEKFKAFAKKAETELSELKLNLPDEIIVIKTTSHEYGGITVAYTRQNAIMFTEKILKTNDEKLYEIFLHEIFHVYSRLNPTKKEALYKIIGFYQANNISLPQDWYDRRLSNPDAPAPNTYIDLTIDNETSTYTPLMYASQPKYDPDKPGGIFQSSTFGLMKVEGNTSGYTPVYDDNKPVIINPANIEDYWKQIGRNTNYIIHPEEIMASNFVHMVLQRDSLPNPEIIDAMRRVISK